MSQDVDAIEQQKAVVKNVFNTVADGYGRGGCRFFHLSGETMADLHDLKGHESVLDIASGTGAAAIPLAHRLKDGNLVALDFSEGMLEQARQYQQSEGLDNIHFQVGDMTAMPFTENSFDHANCAFGLFFIEDMVSLLSHISSKVKPGGRVMISGFCGDSFEPMAKLTFARLKSYGLEVPDEPSWRKIAQPHQLQQLFDDAGLEDMQLVRKTHGYYIDAEGWWDILWNAGFRGLIEQLGDDLEKFKQELSDEVSALADEKGIWLEVDVNYTSGKRV